MKKYLLLLLLLPATGVQGQTWSEWFRQKKTQINYLTEQIAALKAYEGYVKKGYEIAEKGITAIEGIKQEDFSLHRDYIISLRKVKPQIKDYRKVADILSLERKILRLCQGHNTRGQQNNRLPTDETRYAASVFASLLTRCKEITEQLIKLTADNTSEMRDDERMRRIDALHADILDTYAFARHFHSEMARHSIQRLQENRDVNTSRVLYGIQ